MATPTQPDPTRFRAADEEDATSKMSLFEHLDELRRRLFYCLAGIAVGFGAAFAIANTAFDYLARPMFTAFRNASIPQQQMVFLTPLEPLNLQITLALYLGLVLASPIVLYQVWRFVAPGLYRNERRATVSFLFSSVFLFLAGTAFGYFIMLPPSLAFLIKFQGPYQPMISIKAYFDMVLIILLGLGVVFQLPILIFFLSLFGIVTPRFLWKHFRYAILIIAIVAAVVTPTTDVVTMSIFMAPMLLLYVLGIGVSYLVARRRTSTRELPASPPAR